MSFSLFTNNYVGWNNITSKIHETLIIEQTKVNTLSLKNIYLYVHNFKIKSNQIRLLLNLSEFYAMYFPKIVGNSLIFINKNVVIFPNSQSS